MSPGIVLPTEEPFLILGGRGMLGRAWCQLLRDKGLPFETADRPDFDLTDFRAVERVIQGRFAAVINCAAWTDVDGAESCEEQATEINGTAVGRLAQRCARLDLRLVHYSTDYVFDGSASTPWRTAALRSPINAYGRSKAKGEELVEASGARAVVVRTSWLYAPWGKNFVATMVRLSQEKPELRVVDDQRGRPTDARMLADVSLRLLSLGVEGIFHVANEGECSWFEFARHIMESLSAPCTVQPCTTNEFPRPALRPTYSVLDLTETERLVGPLPDWRPHVTDVARLLRPAAVGTEHDPL